MSELARSAVKSTRRAAANVPQAHHNTLAFALGCLLAVGMIVFAFWYAAPTEQMLEDCMNAGLGWNEARCKHELGAR